MDLNLNSINKNWKTAGIIVLAAGALVYPAMRLYKYIAQRRRNMNEDEGTEHTIKAFSPSYRGHHKPHRRKAEHEAHLQDGQTA